MEFYGDYLGLYRGGHLYFRVDWIHVGAPTFRFG